MEPKKLTILKGRKDFLLNKKEAKYAAFSNGPEKLGPL